MGMNLTGGDICKKAHYDKDEYCFDLFTGFCFLDRHLLRIPRNGADVTASRAYRKGNNYQKDLLLFVDLLQNCHPAFAPDRPTPFDLQSERKQGYRWARTCGSDARFRSYLQGIVSRLRDGHSFLLPMLDYGRIYPFAVLPVNGRIVLQAVDKRYAQ